MGAKRGLQRKRTSGTTPWSRVLVVAGVLLLTSGLEAQVTEGEDASQQRAVPAAWTGDSGVVIAVTDDAGSPVPGVTVELRLEEQSGGFAVQTDAEGRITVEGLAAGEWQIDLRREGFMLVTAYLRLDPGKDPELGFSSRQRTGTFWAPLNAVFLPTDLPLTSAASTGRRSAKATRKEADRVRKQARRDEERAERRQRRGQLARVVEPAEPPRARPVGSEDDSETPTAVQTRRDEAPPPRASPQPRPDVESEPAAGVETTPTVAQAQPEAGPEAGETAEPPPPEPAAAVAEAPAGPRLLPNPDLLPAGPCPECRPGEWSVSVQLTASARAGELPCDTSAATEISSLIPEVAAALDERTAQFAGALAARDENDLVRLFAVDASSDLGSRLRSTVSEASCLPIAVVIPKGSKYIGFRYQAGERRFMGECPPDQDCQVSQARWRGPPKIVETDSVTVVHGTFENLHPRREREARLTVYFVPPRGWLPPG